MHELPSKRYTPHEAKTECGIHTRTTFAGAPHGGSLVDLMVKDSGFRVLTVGCTV